MNAVSHARNRYVIGLELHDGEGSNYDQLTAILDDLNAVEILDGLWVTDCDSSTEACHILWRLIRVLGGDDRAMVMDLYGRQWYAFRPANDFIEVRDRPKYLPAEGQVM